MSETIRVMIVDDHDMVRRGLAVFLKTKADLSLVGEASNGQEALDKCEQLQPDIVLMDLVMPTMGGAEATRLIRERWPHVQVIALTSFQEKELVQEALQAGAISYLLKSISVHDLAQAIRAAYTGRSTLSPEATQALIRLAGPEPAPGHDLPASPRLTCREREVLTLVTSGLTNLEIAGRLNVSHSTARAHVSNILAKLGVSNRGEAIALALRRKWVT